MIDPAAIRTYCEIVFRDPPRGGLIALRGFSEPKKDNNSSHTPWIDPFAPGWIDSVVSFVQTCDDKGLAAYCIPGFVAGRGATASDVLTLPTLVIDFDKGDIVENYMKATRILGRPSLAVRSGGRVNDHPKTHLYWRLTGDTTAERVTMLRGLAASLFGGDNMFGAGRAHQPIRIAGSVHRKAEPVPVEIAYISTLVLDVEEAERRLVTVSAPRPTANSGPTSYGLPRPNTLGLQRKVSLDELPIRYVGHGDPDINRFETLTRMMGMMLNNIHDTNDSAECAAKFAEVRQWLVAHVENVERDYDLRKHWRGLLKRECWKRQQPRRAYRPAARARTF